MCYSLSVNDMTTMVISLALNFPCYKPGIRLHKINGIDSLSWHPCRTFCSFETEKREASFFPSTSFSFLLARFL